MCKLTNKKTLFYHHLLVTNDHHHQDRLVGQTKEKLKHVRRFSTGTVEWEPDNTTLTMQFINTAAQPISSIEFSDPLLDQIQAASVTSSASNWMSIPTDCPQV
eukprot:COSAG06_NODE_1792_length_8393_cov_4.896552_4_plen_103_part_00